MKLSPVIRLQTALLLLLLCLVETASSETVEIQDLHYGEVLFHFYQKDYFTALTHLLAARDREQLPHHQQQAELLTGGMELSYGMSRDAELHFKQTLDQTTDQETRNRVWYYLGKLAYQKGQYSQTEDYLSKVNTSVIDKNTAERQLLRANTLMQLGRNKEAAQQLSTVHTQPLQEFFLINRGIAELRAGNVQQGRQTISSLNTLKFRDEKLKSLRDRANLALGFQLLNKHETDQSIEALDNIRLNGPYSQEALLAVGWAHLEAGQYADALTPWLELGKRNGFDIAVQEAQLAIPYALEMMGDAEQAIQYYSQAIAYFENESTLLDTAIETLQQQGMETLLETGSQASITSWLDNSTLLAKMPAEEYLIDLLISHPFRIALNQYRDLAFLDNKLTQWRDNISLFSNVIETRKINYDNKSPATRQFLSNDHANQLTTLYQSLETRYQAQLQSRDPLALASQAELTTWQTIAAMEERIKQMPPSDKLVQHRERLTWLKGILYWKIQDDYAARLWSVRKLLNVIKVELTKATQKQQQVSNSLASSNPFFTGYNERIDVLAQRIKTLQPKVIKARQQSADTLAQLMLKQLNQRQLRLSAYLSQIRYSLARNHDLLAAKQP
ncbi:MAG: tetratricopeptide repeat protein [Gammaproteobacteria bacterium]